MSLPGVSLGSSSVGAPMGPQTPMRISRIAFSGVHIRKLLNLLHLRDSKKTLHGTVQLFAPHR